MMKYAPRCMRCATALETNHQSLGGMVRLALRRKLYCPHCKMDVPKSGAIAMGQAYGMCLSHLRKEVAQATGQLRSLELNDALRALDPAISREQIQPAHTIENVVRSARETYRPVLLDEAHGRSATLEVGLKRDAQGNVIACGVWGMTSAESGDREWDMLVARVGAEQYIVYLPPKPTHWLHEAIRHKVGQHAAAQGPGRAATPRTALAQAGH